MTSLKAPVPCAVAREGVSSRFILIWLMVGSGFRRQDFLLTGKLPELGEVELRGEYRACLLDGDRALQAYPLVSQLDRDLTLDAWRDFVDEWVWTAPEGVPEQGILGLEINRRYLKAMCCFRLADGPDAVLTLAVPFLVMSDTLGAGAVSPVMFEALDAMAKRRGCGVMQLRAVYRLDQPTDLARLHDVHEFLGRGHGADG